MAIKNKAKALTGINPLAYLGVEPTTPPQFVTDNRAPTARDFNGYNLGTIWLNTVTEMPYMLTNKDNGVATWTLLSPGGTGAHTFETNVAGPVFDNAGVLNVYGDGLTISTDGSVANTVTISLAANPVIPGVITEWSREAGNAVPMVIDHGYINANAGLTTFTLPVLAPYGSIIKILGEGAGLWSIAQNAGQNIQIGATSTTIGVAGSFNASKANDSITLVCRVADTTWQVDSAVGGPFNLI